MKDMVNSAPEVSEYSVAESHGKTPAEKTRIKTLLRKLKKLTVGAQKVMKELNDFGIE